MEKRAGVSHSDLKTPIRSVIDSFSANGSVISLNRDLEIQGDLFVNDITATGTIEAVNVTATGTLSGSHTGLSDIGTNTHAQIDTFIAKFPSGLVMMYGGAAAPTGWVLCDGASLLRAGTYADLFAAIGTTFGSVDGTHFNVPDFRGIFPRGAGTNGTLANANAVAFTGTLGTYQNDKIQGHWHHSYMANTTGGSEWDTTFAANQFRNTNNSRAHTNYVQEAIIDGANGEPRFGTETNPANLGITFIIKI